ncbi:MAG: hypothetical protein QOG34_2471 [Frankiaceae bacterium]|nr:hypothetical protein [Frankiaceae bacterium]
MVDIDIVGESFHEDYIRQIRSRYADREFEIVLVPEPNNPYDPNAVAIHVDGGIVGHLARDMAASWQPRVLAAAAEGFVVAGTAAIFGGTQDKPNLGVFGAAPWPGPGPAPADRWSR